MANNPVYDLEFRVYLCFFPHSAMSPPTCLQVVVRSFWKLRPGNLKVDFCSGNSLIWFRPKARYVLPPGCESDSAGLVQVRAVQTNSKTPSKVCVTELFCKAVACQNYTRPLTLLILAALGFNQTLVLSGIVTLAKISIAMHCPHLPSTIHS